MIPVDQTTFGDGSDGKEPGNCFAACLASVLELPLSEVPNFMTEYEPVGWFLKAQRWLGGRGLAILDLHYEDGAPDEFWTLPVVQPGQIWIAAGMANRDGREIRHCVVMRGPEREMLHDPNPLFGRAGIKRVDALTFIMPLDPAAVARGNSTEGVRQ